MDSDIEALCFAKFHVIFKRRLNLAWLYESHRLNFIEADKVKSCDQAAELFRIVINQIFALRHFLLVQAQHRACSGKGQRKAKIG